MTLNGTNNSIEYHDCDRWCTYEHDYQNQRPLTTIPRQCSRIFNVIFHILKYSVDERRNRKSSRIFDRFVNNAMDSDDNVKDNIPVKYCDCPGATLFALFTTRIFEYSPLINFRSKQKLAGISWPRMCEFEYSLFDSGSESESERESEVKIDKVCNKITTDRDHKMWHWMALTTRLMTTIDGVHINITIIINVQ